MGLSVLKVGGSVFSGAPSYERVARALGDRLTADPGAHLLVVVSAENGATDALLGEARALAAEPPGAALDLLWSTGELRSAALLAIALGGVGVAASALNVHQAGLIRSEDGRIEAHVERVRLALSRHRVVVVPGFLAVDETGAIVSLGRGGSDLSAVLLARALGAGACELIKDVPGFFTTDPNRDRHAVHLPRITYAEAIARAREGCRLVQRQALEAAAECGLPLIVRTLTAGSQRTVVAGGLPRGAALAVPAALSEE